MEKWKLNGMAWGFLGLAAIVVAMMLTSVLSRPHEITLPDTDMTAEQESALEGGALTLVEITPETVQTAIATLARPESYRRMVTVEQFWDGGSGSYELAVTVSGSWTRIDRTMPDGRVRHSILGPETVYVWYNNEADIFEAPTGSISADNEQTIPTYEEILELPTRMIAEADYRTISDLNCIYTEAVDGEESLRYWVCVDTGLLVAAERLIREETVYRMGAPTLDVTEITAADFTLPDGRVLAEIGQTSRSQEKE